MDLDEALRIMQQGESPKGVNIPMLVMGSALTILALAECWVVLKFLGM